MKHPTRSIHLFSSAPRAHLFFAASRSCSSNIRRSLSTSPIRLRDEKSPAPTNPLGSFSSFNSGPAPPRLPKEEQEIFESLQRASTGAFSTPRAPPQINQSPDSSPAEAASGQATVDARAEKLGTASAGGEADSKFKDQYDRIIEARGKGEELHPNVRRGAQPEFEGDVNPKTGEVGGPKNEPLRWGATGEWTYNGRATDF